MRSFPLFPASDQYRKVVRDKIRRNSKQLFQRRQSSVSSVPSTSTTKSIKPYGLTFFDLPAEIRNAIYEHVASTSSICIQVIDKNGQPPPPPVPSMLQVSRQTRREYLPLLLELASVRVLVKDFDFRDLGRFASSLYSTQLKALRDNERLRIQLVAKKCNKDTIVSLRRWLDNRAHGLDRLPWHYGIYWKPQHQVLPTSTAVQTTNTYIMRRKVLHQNVEALAQLHKNVSETLQFELQPIIDAFETELHGTRAEPDSPWRDDSALLMYRVWGGTQTLRGR